tara:strand:+ start:384 stop:785 length:402 start_codon:yes stop_codon:yes gene_type:complete
VSIKQKGISIQISPGELLDKVSILEIKLEQITDSQKKSNVKIEYDLLMNIVANNNLLTHEVTLLYQQLKSINQSLWTIEDDIRDCERDKDFSDQFIKLARSVYITNDKRAEIKKQINTTLGSVLVEEKSYQSY